jgi:hypothetical protein
MMHGQGEEANKRGEEEKHGVYESCSEQGIERRKEDRRREGGREGGRGEIEGLQVRRGKKDPD